MKDMMLLKQGEIVLKGLNRKFFENKLSLYMCLIDIHNFLLSLNLVLNLGDLLFLFFYM